jgi:RecA-family ATPase
MIVPNLWQAKTMALLTGDGSQGKTHLTLQLLVALASGGEFGEGVFEVSTEPRSVVYITQEDEADFIRDEILTQFPELKNRSDVTGRIRIISTAFSGANIYLAVPGTHQGVFSHIPEGAVFVLDSWSTFLTSNENDNTSLLKDEIAALRSIMKKQKAYPLILHHRPRANPQSGFQGTSRGGTALPNACRFHMMIERDTKKGRSRLSFERVSRGTIPTDIPLVFDESRRLFVRGDADPYLKLFKDGEQLTTTEIIERLGKDPTSDDDRKTVLNALGYREKHGLIFKASPGARNVDAKWTRLDQ